MRHTEGSVPFLSSISNQQWRKVSNGQIVQADDGPARLSVVSVSRSVLPIGFMILVLGTGLLE